MAVRPTCDRCAHCVDKPGLAYLKGCERFGSTVNPHMYCCACFVERKGARE